MQHETVALGSAVVPGSVCTIREILYSYLLHQIGIKKSVFLFSTNISTLLFEQNLCVFV